MIRNAVYRILSLIKFTRYLERLKRQLHEELALVREVSIFVTTALLIRAAGTLAWPRFFYTFVERNVKREHIVCVCACVCAGISERKNINLALVLQVEMQRGS